MTPVNGAQTRGPGDNSVRHLSRALFRQDCKLEVIAAIARHPSGRFTLFDLVPSEDVASRYHKALQDLCDAHLLQRLPKEGRLQPYLRAESDLWAWADNYVGQFGIADGQG